MMIWQDRNMSECFKVFYVKLYVHSLVDKLKWFYINARCYNKIYLEVNFSFRADMVQGRQKEFLWPFIQIFCVFCSSKQSTEQHLCLLRITPCSLVHRYGRFEGSCDLRKFDRFFTATTVRRLLCEELNVDWSQEDGDSTRTRCTFGTIMCRIND